MSKAKKAPRVQIIPFEEKGQYRYRITQGGRNQDVLSESLYKTPSAAIQAGIRLLRQFRKLSEDGAIVERCNVHGDINSSNDLKAL